MRIYYFQQNDSRVINHKQHNCMNLCVRWTPESVNGFGERVREIKELCERGKNIHKNIVTAGGRTKIRPRRPNKDKLLGFTNF